MGDVRVIDSDPLGERIKEFCCAKRAYVIAAVIFLAITVVVITVAVVLINRSNSSGGLAIDYSRALFVTDDQNLWALDLSSSNRTILAKSRKGIAAFDLYRKSTLYYHGRDSPWIVSLSSKYSDLAQTRPWLPTSLAVDSVTGNVYVLDGLAGKVNVYRLDTARFGIAIADLREPSDLALDPARGVMFVLQKRHSILKVNMDGSSPQRIIVDSTLVSLAVEAQTAKLYFSTLDVIASCDYAGSDLRVVVRTTSTALSLAVSGSRLFWTQAPLSTGFGMLRACSVATSGNCSDQQEFDFVDPRAARVYQGDYSASLANPCQESNGGCDQLCLLKPSGHSCACYVGYELDDDERSCHQVEEYLLYTRGEFVRGRVTNARRNTFTDAIEPFSFQAGKLNNKSTVDFDYNYAARKIAIAHDDAIEVMDLDKRGTAAPEGYSGDGCVKQLAYDWVTGDVYYVRDTCSLSFTSGVLVFQPSQWTYKTKTLQVFAEGTGQPRALAMHPNNGMYFFTMKREDSVSVFRIRGFKTTLIASESVNETALAIDFAESRLYWFSADLKLVRSADFEGKDSRAVNVSVIDEPRSISVDDRYIYVSNLTSIWRVVKGNGYGAVKLVPAYDDDSADKLISGVKVYSRESQLMDASNPCSKNNGDCEEFCFRTPFILSSGSNSVNDTGEVKKTCLCEDYKTIRPDGRSCDFERVTQDPRIYGHA